MLNGFGQGMVANVCFNRGKEGRGKESSWDNSKAIQVLSLQAAPEH